MILTVKVGLTAPVADSTAVEASDAIDAPLELASVAAELTLEEASLRTL